MVHFVIIKMMERQQFIKGAHKKCHLESFFKSGLFDTAASW